MKKKTYRIWLVIPLIVLLGVACSLLGGEQNVVPTQSQENPPTAAIGADQGGSGGEQSFDTEFPLPEDVQGFMHLGQGDKAINFQTKMTFDEAVAFYRAKFKEMGLSEETILTSIEDEGFSMVFKGSANGKALVIQGVDLGNGTINLNIRYEDL